MRLVAAFFGDIKGYFVEVGANDPRERSQTWHLEQAGWTGVLIEPQPDLANKLRAMRKAKVFAVACSAPGQCRRTLPLHVAGPLSSLDRERMAPGATPETVIKVPIRTLDSVLEEAGSPARFDFLSIDVEGHEIEVLRGFDIARWRPRLILLEDHVADLSKHRFLVRPAIASSAATRTMAGMCRAILPPCADGRTVGKSCANIISRCRSVCCAIFRVACASRSGLSFAPDRMARRRLPALRLFVAFGVAIECAFEISERDDEAGPAVDESELEDIVLEE